MTSITFEIKLPDLLLGVVESTFVPNGPADAALDTEIKSAIAKRVAGAPSDTVKTIIRDLLRAGGYKPAGRGKPASEYLAQAAERGEFPRISHIVDSLNLVSRESGLPISLLDADRVMDGTDALVIRFGRPDESYVFNAIGHEIDVEGLVLVARRNGPALGNPVKDSMMAKTTDGTKRTIAFVWASRRALSQSALNQVCQRLGHLLRGAETEVRVLVPETGNSE
ncbi:MAG TPA: phenylalanine--tRNA ligase beta subunit-related protein [Terriglobia bacterium]|nr:phenylalanine--tRNA ligase beta subunit-related protein [Terriglobia bacterium]